MCTMRARLRSMTFSPTVMPACRRASSRQSSAERSCVKRDRARNAMDYSKTLKNNILTYPSLWADCCFKRLSVHYMPTLCRRNRANFLIFRRIHENDGGKIRLLPGQVERLARVLPGLLAVCRQTADLAEPYDPLGITLQPARADFFPDPLLHKCVP